MTLCLPAAEDLLQLCRRWEGRGVPGTSPPSLVCLAPGQGFRSYRPGIWWLGSERGSQVAPMRGVHRRSCHPLLSSLNLSLRPAESSDGRLGKATLPALPVSSSLFSLAFLPLIFCFSLPYPAACHPVSSAFLCFSFTFFLFPSASFDHFPDLPCYP